MRFTKNNRTHFALSDAQLVRQDWDIKIAEIVRETDQETYLAIPRDFNRGADFKVHSASLLTWRCAEAPEECHMRTRAATFRSERE